MRDDVASVHDQATRRRERPPLGWVKTFLAPAVIAALISAVVSALVAYWSAQEAAREHTRTYEQSFEDLLSKQVIATKIFSVSDSSKGVERQQLAIEQQVASELLALEGMAETEQQRQTVLLFAARLIAGNPAPLGGGPSARVLSVLIQQIDSDLRLGRDRQTNQYLHDLTRSRAFFDLVTAGISEQYYSDDIKHENDEDYTQFWTTLHGDEPLPVPAIRDLLLQIGPDVQHIDGWIDVATFNTSYRIRKDLPARNRTPAVKPKTAQKFIDWTIAVASGNLSKAGDVIAQYAIEVPSSRAGKGFGKLLIAPSTWKNGGQSGVLMLDARLLRDRPPVVFINPNGSFRKGTLGRVIGAVPATACLDIAEPVHNVLVFVDSKYVPDQEPGYWYGLIHVWAHVTPSKDGCAFPTPVPGAQ